MYQQPSKAADPKRFTRRHHYQEGPGFLFLATQGGRPPGSRPHANLTALRRRRRAVRLAREQGVAAACREVGCSRASLYRWLAAYQAHGIEGLREGSRRPLRSVCLPSWVAHVVITIRLLTYWNSKRIAAEMERRQIYRVGHDYIDRLLASKGCARGSVMRERGPRYERTRPNELWHIDIKGPFFIRLAAGGSVKTWIVGIVDDHSRFIVGLRIHTDAQAVPILRWLDACFDFCGHPLELMSDNGQPFVTWMPYVLTRFGKRLKELHINHLRTQINSPWTNGKIEAFWLILQSEVLDRQIFGSLVEAEAALGSFVAYYNYHRLSGVLGWLTPGERYDGTPFNDRGFENIPRLAHLQPWLDELMRAA